MKNPKRGSTYSPDFENSNFLSRQKNARSESPLKMTRPSGNEGRSGNHRLNLSAVAGFAGVVRAGKTVSRQTVFPWPRSSAFDDEKRPEEFFDFSSFSTRSRYRPIDNSMPRASKWTHHEEGKEKKGEEFRRNTDSLSSGVLLSTINYNTTIRVMKSRLCRRRRRCCCVCEK